MSAAFITKRPQNSACGGGESLPCRWGEAIFFQQKLTESFKAEWLASKATDISATICIITQCYWCKNKITSSLKPLSHLFSDDVVWKKNPKKLGLYSRECVFIIPRLWADEPAHKVASVLRFTPLIRNPAHVSFMLAPLQAREQYRLSHPNLPFFLLLLFFFLLTPRCSRNVSENVKPG